MLKIVFLLFIIRLRKLLPKDDYLAIIFFIAFYCFSVYYLCVFSIYKDYVLLSTIEILMYQLNRKDLELLKQYKKFRILLFLEYLIYSFPYLVSFSLNKKWFFLLVYLFLIFIFVNIPKYSFKVTPLPFKLFNPFWHISFRKNKLFIFMIFAIFIVYMGYSSKNKNLIIAGICIFSFIATAPSFYRETLDQVKSSSFLYRNYLLKQISSSIINTLILTIPLIAVLLTISIDYLLFLPIVFIVPIYGILFKYSFWNNILKQQILFFISLLATPFGLPIIILPLLYYNSIKTINNIQNA